MTASREEQFCVYLHERLVGHLVNRVLAEWPVAATLLADRPELCRPIERMIRERAAQLLMRR